MHTYTPPRNPITTFTCFARCRRIFLWSRAMSPSPRDGDIIPGKWSHFGDVVTLLCSGQPIPVSITPLPPGQESPPPPHGGPVRHPGRRPRCPPWAESSGTYSVPLEASKGGVEGWKHPPILPRGESTFVSFPATVQRPRGSCFGTHTCELVCSFLAFFLYSGRDFFAVFFFAMTFVVGFFRTVFLSLFIVWKPRVSICPTEVGPSMQMYKFATGLIFIVLRSSATNLRGMGGGWTMSASVSILDAHLMTTGLSTPPPARPANRAPVRGFGKCAHLV